MHYVSNVLGIRDPIHKQKIALKAMDVVLFGPPRGNQSDGMQTVTTKFSILSIPFRRNWNPLERLYFGNIIVKCNHRMLVRISAE